MRTSDDSNKLAFCDSNKRQQARQNTHDRLGSKGPLGSLLHQHTLFVAPQETPVTGHCGSETHGRCTWQHAGQGEEWQRLPAERRSGHDWVLGVCQACKGRQSAPGSTQLMTKSGSGACHASPGAGAAPRGVSRRASSRRAAYSSGKLRSRMAASVTDTGSSRPTCRTCTQCKPSRGLGSKVYGKQIGDLY